MARKTSGKADETATASDGSAITDDAAVAEASGTGPSGVSEADLLSDALTIDEALTTDGYQPLNDPSDDSFRRREQAPVQPGVGDLIAVALVLSSAVDAVLGPSFGMTGTPSSRPPYR